MGLGAPPRHCDVVLSLERLAGVVEYVPEDLTVTVQAGMPLAELEALVAGRNQEVPLDPMGSGATTVGGILAAGAVGPRRMLYGGPRDVLLGARVALADGRVIRSGGRVVKNVAGYDLNKLWVGSLGTLGVLTEVTLKLRPKPACRQTFCYSFGDLCDALQAAEIVLGSELLPAAVTLLSPGAAVRLGLPASFVLAVELAESQTNVAYQVGRLKQMMDGFGGRLQEIQAGHSAENRRGKAIGPGEIQKGWMGGPEEIRKGQPSGREEVQKGWVGGPEEIRKVRPSGREEIQRGWMEGPEATRKCWAGGMEESGPGRTDRLDDIPADLAGELQSEPGDRFWRKLRDFHTVSGACWRVRVSTVTSDLEELVRLALSGPGVDVIAHVGSGSLFVYGQELDPHTVTALQNRAAALGGAGVLEEAPPELKRQVEVWGPPRPEWRLMRQIKERLDPGGVLNPGRFVGGI